MRFPLAGCLPLFVFASLCSADPEVRPEDLPRPQPLPPEKAAASCAVRSGFRVELMAAEPLVMDPVAMAFDENGRLYVVEMRDYSERRDEKLGRVKLLEDTDGDGRYDRASVFAEGLPWPTGIACWDGGVFVLASPDLLYFKDMDGDRKADVHALIFTGFGNLAPKLNVQALPNSLQWGPDQRIHGALGGNSGSIQNFAQFGAPKVELRGRDFSFDPRLMDLRPESGGGQFGLTFDDTGRKFVCSNSRHLMQVMYEDRAAAQVKDYPLPAPAQDIAADGPQAEVFRRSPDEAWRVIRTKWRVSGAVKGPVEGGGRASGYFTSASGVTIYRGDAWPKEYRGDAFIADCGSNLIHHKKLTGDLVRTGRRAPGEERSEFVASTDNWFRPVAFANAPDGTLWFADMYREVIEHPWSLPESLKEHLDLSSGNDRGRLYRIVPENYRDRPAPRLGDASTAELAALIEHPNGWTRDTAARLLHERQDPAAKAPLAALAERSGRAYGRLLALHVLQGMSALDAPTLERALRDADADVRANAVRLCAVTGLCADRVAGMAGDASPRVRAETGWALAVLAPENKADAVATLLQKADEPWLRHAALAAADGAVDQVLSKLAERDPTRADALRSMFGEGSSQPAPLPPTFGAAASRAEAAAQFRPALELTGDAAKGRVLFDSRCALCHRLGGRGAAVGPDLDAARVGGREKLLGNILEPSREITAGYAAGAVTTKGGDTLHGILLNETPAGVVLRLPGGFERILRARDVARVERSARSLMPDGLEAGLTAQEMADLLEFLTKGGEENVVTLNLEPSRDIPRNSEGAFARLKSGRLIFYYTQFYGGAADESPARIAGVHSDDVGQTWSAPEPVVENAGNCNVMSVSLLRLQSGKLALFYLVKNGWTDCRAVVRYSSDEAATWSEPQPVGGAPGNFVLNNDRVIQLAGGRLIAPLAFHRSRGTDPHSAKSFDSRAIAMWLLSDDEGQTWREAATWWAMPVRSGSGLQEPGAVELADGKLLGWARTDQGAQYGFASSDGGNVWTPPARTAMQSPLSPASIKRLPDSPDLLAVFNDHSGAFPYPKGKRTPLVAAISHDNGQTWPHRRLIEGDPDGWYCYTAIHFTEDAALLAYCAGDSKVGGLNRLRIRRVSLDWLRSNADSAGPGKTEALNNPR